jgi:hypothetical protein
MSFANKASKLLTNKYFLYVIVFLAVTNVIGYLAMNRINAVIFFALVSLLMSNFSKNMAVILLVALLATNLLMANKTMREGMEGETTSETDTTTKPTIDKEKANEAISKLGSVDPKFKEGVDSSSTNPNADAVKEKIRQRFSSSSDYNQEIITDPNNPDMNTTTEESFENQPTAYGTNNKKKNNSRIDFASTLEESYDNLNNMLGSDGINKLTSDTEKLMKQQQKLFDSMQTMAPLIENAKNMIDGMDLKSLGGLANLATSFTGPK